MQSHQHPCRTVRTHAIPRDSLIFRMSLGAIKKRPHALEENEGALDTQRLAGFAHEMSKTTVHGNVRGIHTHRFKIPTLARFVEQRVVQHIFGLHVLECLSGLCNNNGVILAIIVTRTIDIVETAKVVRAPDTQIRHSELLHELRHVDPAVKRARDCILGFVVEGRANQIGSIVIVRVIQIDDCLRRAQRMHEERIIRPAGTRVLREPNVVLIEERLVVQRGPDARMDLDKQRVFLERERLLRRLDALMELTVNELLLLWIVPLLDIPPRRLDDVDALLET